eukprot:m.191059 g.191059  ORF g.191059 m.191059 type:complete len:198 (+) comp18228_c0_seq1:242-835(+)
MTTPRLVLGLPRPQAIAVLQGLVEGISPFARENLGVQLLEVGLSAGQPRSYRASEEEGSRRTDCGTVREDIAIRLPYKESFVGNPQLPCLHGGVIAALLDHTAGFTAWAALPSLKHRVSTVNLRVDYITPAPCTNHVAIGTLVHAGNKIITADAIVFPEDNPDQLVATCRGTFAVNKTEDPKAIAFLESFLAGAASA